MSAITEAVQTRGLCKSFHKKVAVHDMDLTVHTGSFHALVGTNGAGKSTLMRLLMGVMWPDAGEVRILGQALPREAAVLRQRVHYIGADGEVFPSFRVSDLCTFGQLLYQRYDAARMQTLLEVLELPLQARISHLSTGMKMQLRLALALAVRPDVLILDEPTGGLDPVVKQHFYQLLMNEVADGRTTVLLATHQVAELEQIVDTVSVMYKGRLVLTQSVAELHTRYRRLQVVTRGDLPPSLVKHPAILELSTVGQVTTLVIDSAAWDAQAALASAGFTQVEWLNVGLEEAVRAVLQGEGYARKGALIS